MAQTELNSERQMTIGRHFEWRPIEKPSRRWAWKRLVKDLRWAWDRLWFQCEKQASLVPPFDQQQNRFAALGARDFPLVIG
jgi:hypothetical protein